MLRARNGETGARRVRAAVLLACALTLLYGLVSLLRTRASLQTPVWGAVVAPEWVLVRGTRPVAVVTLAIPDVRHAGFRNASLAEKAAYAAARGYWFVACDKSLDSARTPVWTKLRLIAAVLEQLAPTVFWVDLDTIIWERDLGVERLLEAAPSADLICQHDFHRYSVYCNAGVMLLRRSEWTYWLLAAAYDSHRVLYLRGLLYNMAEQDALNFAATASQARPRGTPAPAQGWKVQVYAYPRLWSFSHEALEEDGEPADGIPTIHFPNCRAGECHDRYMALARRALDMPTAEGSNNARRAKPRVRRTFGDDMERKALPWGRRLS